MKRHEFDTKTRAAAWERCGGRCEGIIDVDTLRYLADPFVRNGFLRRRCNAPIDLGTFHYDHIDPDCLSGRNDLGNCQVLCMNCHRDKTAIDKGTIAKVRRIQLKRIKAKTSTRHMPFGKRSKWKKTMSGKIVLR